METHPEPQVHRVRVLQLCLRVQRIRELERRPQRFLVRGVLLFQVSFILILRKRGIFAFLHAKTSPACQDRASGGTDAGRRTRRSRRYSTMLNVFLISGILSSRPRRRCARLLSM